MKRVEIVKQMLENHTSPLSAVSMAHLEEFNYRLTGEFCNLLPLSEPYKKVQRQFRIVLNALANQGYCTKRYIGTSMKYTGDASRAKTSLVFTKAN